MGWDNRWIILGHVVYPVFFVGGGMSAHRSTKLRYTKHQKLTSEISVGFSTVVATNSPQIQGFTPDCLRKTKKTTSVVHIHVVANIPCESTSGS